MGESDYLDTNIYIEYGDLKEMLLTVKHELMHVWLYENGHTNQNKEEIFSYEDLCEYSALAHDSVERIYREYIDNLKS